MNIGFNPLRDMLLAIIVLSLPFYFILNRERKHSNATALHAAFVLFDSANIAGRIDTIVFRNQIETLKVDNSDKEYLFVPHISKEGAFFHAQSQKGDSVIKPPYSSTLTVKTKERTFVYGFRKY